MDVTSTPPRVEISVSPARMDMRETTGTMTGRSETKTPVTETGAAADVQRRGVEPLDLFQVGDNDDIPVPPEPPRPPLALLALDPADIAPEEPEDAEPDRNSEPDQVTGPAVTDAAEAQAEDATGRPAVPTEAYQAASTDPVERTVDIRR